MSETQKVSNEENVSTDLQQVNNISQPLFLVGIVVIIGSLIAGYMLAQVPSESYLSDTEFSLPLFLMYAIGGISAGLLLMGVSKMLVLLFEISQKLSK